MKLTEQIQRMKKLSGMALNENQDRQTVLQHMYSKSKKLFDAWLEENNPNVESEEERMHELETFLDDQFSIILNENGCISFDKLGRNEQILIGKFPVQLYHYTSSTLVDSIKKHGLQPGHHQTNPHQNSYAGVYLTTEYSGPAVQGYKQLATSEHGGDPVRITVKTFLSEISPDPDDQDIQSGERQFVCGGLAPDRVLNIEVAW